MRSRKSKDPKGWDEIQAMVDSVPQEIRRLAAGCLGDLLEGNTAQLFGSANRPECPNIRVGLATALTLLSAVIGKQAYEKPSDLYEAVLGVESYHDAFIHVDKEHVALGLSVSETEDKISLMTDEDVKAMAHERVAERDRAITDGMEGQFDGYL